MTAIRNIVFDLGGVLVDLDMQSCIDAFNRLEMPQIAELINPYYPAEIFAQLERGDLTPHETCEEMRRMTGRTEVTDAQIADAYGHFLVGIPIAKLRLIEALRTKGLRTYILSNNNALVMPRIREELFTADGRTMNDYFDKIYLSYELHELKPSPAIFQKMIADSGMLPEESLFIDDGKKNVDTALELGFGVYMPSPHEDFRHLFDELLK